MQPETEWGSTSSEALPSWAKFPAVADTARLKKTMTIDVVEKSIKEKTNIGFEIRASGLCPINGTLILTTLLIIIMIFSVRDEL